MASKPKKFHIVLKGHKPGLYKKWFGPGGAAEQIANFAQAKYQGFYTYEEALNWLRELNPIALPPNLAQLLAQETQAAQTLTAAIAQHLQAGKVVLFTDGSAQGATGLGGYGVILKYKDISKELSGGFCQTTNNRMELRACIEGLRALKKKSDIVLFTDSQYIVNSLTQGWAKRWRARGWMRNAQDRAENADLWATLLDLCAQHTVEVQWVRGHNGTPDNERCDHLAQAAAQQPNLLPDIFT